MLLKILFFSALAAGVCAIVRQARWRGGLQRLHQNVRTLARTLLLLALCLLVYRLFFGESP
ncbi:hypothetical protein [Conchiformibius kuhniae]|uniref:Uncharacterized protein n=1 Tax=Conchiformibius kuhniae TaxID=211502 RepID=A0A8T9MW36_9NEIS|nr:hypothetical protein [Conchiformibius kuhniae]UOP04113.1 hypothetical protein LVJ77_06475 [Conchiformibius kuhniae]